MENERASTLYMYWRSSGNSSSDGIMRCIRSLKDEGGGGGGTDVTVYKEGRMTMMMPTTTRVNNSDFV
jgi:hypothetical protein